MTDRHGAREVPFPGLVARDLRAMNTDIRLVAAGPRAEHRLARGAAWLAAFEKRFSRFLGQSELSRLNASAGRPFRVSLALFRIVSLALEHARRSGGIFDPTVLRHLERAGYDRSFDLIARSPPAGPARVASASWRDVRLDPAARTVTLPPGVGIDLGGVGKGYAVDRVAGILGSPCLVNCGGDLFADGRPAAHDWWRVGVSDPFAPGRDLLLLRVGDRGVATSNTRARRWTAGGRPRHHLIDPRTGDPSVTDAVQVTVVARTTTEADFHAKVALLQGAEAGIRYINAQPDVEAIAVRLDGSQHQSAAITDYFEERAR